MTILDTNVVSEVMKPTPSPNLTAWLSGQRLDELFITAITVAETLYGIGLLPKGKRRDALLREADSAFTDDFAGRILVYDESAARIFALISAARRSQGRPIGIHDAQIAAIARANNAALATRDVGDFESCGVKLVNPWQEMP
jgi:predicted nucleic acid-binding protein